MNQGEMNQTKSPFKHKAVYCGKTFQMNGKKYRYLEGIWMVINHKIVDAVKFEQVLSLNERDEPIPTFRMEETEFFLKTEGLF